MPTYTLSRHDGFCWPSIFLHISIYRRGSCTSRIRPSGREYHPHLQLAQIAAVARSMRELRGQDVLSIRGLANPVAIEVHHYIPTSLNVSSSFPKV